MSSARPRRNSTCRVRGSRRVTRMARAAPSPRRLPRRWRWGSRSTRPCDRRARISKGRSATPRGLERDMDRSTISGGYTEQMAGGSALLLTPEPLDPARVAAAVARSGDGAVCTFVGLVRDHNAGRRVLWLDYEAFAPLALKAFEQIVSEA